MNLYGIVKRDVVSNTESVEFMEARDITEAVSKIEVPKNNGVYVYNVNNVYRDFKYKGLPVFIKTTEQELFEELLGWLRFNRDVEPLDLN